MELQEYREQAQKAAMRAGPRPFRIFIVYALVLSVLNFVGFLLLEPLAGWQTACYQFIAAGNYELPLPSASVVYGSLLSRLLALLGRVVTAGWVAVMLRITRGGEGSWHDLWEAFPHFWKVFVIDIVGTVCCAAGLCLFIVPGVWLFYNWRLSLFVLAEHPEYGPIQCMKQSRRLMKGERMNLFRLDLSCWLLYGLAALTFYVTSGILPLWRMPSLMFLYAVFYNRMVYWREPAEGEAPGAQE